MDTPDEPNDVETPPNKDDKTFGMLCHLLAFAGCVIPVGSIVGPLVMWLIKKDSSDFVDRCGKESVNFQISIALYSLAAAPLCFLFIGFLILIAIGIFTLVCVIQASIKANEGQDYIYPYCIRFIK